MTIYIGRQTHQHPNRPISAQTTASLDGLRFAAAFYVVLHHLAKKFGAAILILRFGQEAVLVFFLLSGFVIYANEVKRVEDGVGYYIRRMIRIYPPLFAAILISVLISIDNKDMISITNMRSLFSTLFGLQDVSALKPGVISDPYLGNTPLWSLSYEMFFYLLFPLAQRFSRRTSVQIATNLIGLISCLSYITYMEKPNHFTLILSYAIIWWTGAMAAQVYITNYKSLMTLLYSTCWLVALTITAAIGIAEIGARGVGVYPLLQCRHFAFSIVCVLVSLSPLASLWSQLANSMPKFSSYLASLSYGFYIFHYPILINWYRIKNTEGYIFAFALLFICAWLFDRVLYKKLSSMFRVKFYGNRLLGGRGDSGIAM